MPPKNFTDIHINPNQHPHTELRVHHPLDGVSSSKDTPGVSGVHIDYGDEVLGGTSDAGRGIAGISDTGIGVYGEGGRLAGLFKGDVEITGNLTIQGVSIQIWLERIIKLEQDVLEIISRLPVKPVVHVRREGPKGIVSGTGFTPNQGVLIEFKHGKKNLSPSEPNFDSVQHEPGWADERGLVPEMSFNIIFGDATYISGAIEDNTTKQVGRDTKVDI